MSGRQRGKAAARVEGESGAAVSLAGTASHKGYYKHPVRCYAGGFERATLMCCAEVFSGPGALGAVKDAEGIVLCLLHIYKYHTVCFA